MGELLQFPDRQAEREQNLVYLVEQYFPEDKEFIIDLEFADALGYIYGLLLDAGEDPDLVLAELGLLEKER